MSIWRLLNNQANRIGIHNSCCFVTDTNTYTKSTNTKTLSNIEQNQPLPYRFPARLWRIRILTAGQMTVDDTFYWGTKGHLQWSSDSIQHTNVYPQNWVIAIRTISNMLICKLGACSVICLNIPHQEVKYMNKHDQVHKYGGQTCMINSQVWCRAVPIVRYETVIETMMNTSTSTATQV